MHPKDAPTASAEDILREVLDVLTNLRNGHFTTHMIEGLPGTGGQIAELLNAHLAMLSELRNEHHRVMEEMGVTGRLGGQLAVANVSGGWKEIVDDANRTAAAITAQFRDGGNIVRAHLRGNAAARMTAECIHGEFRQFREDMNRLLDQMATGSKSRQNKLP